jgi:hypothetical protein
MLNMIYFSYLSDYKNPLPSFSCPWWPVMADEILYLNLGRQYSTLQKHRTHSIVYG